MGRFSPFAGFLLKYLFIFSSISVNFARSLPFMKKQNTSRDIKWRALYNSSKKEVFSERLSCENHLARGSCYSIL